MATVLPVPVPIRCERLSTALTSVLVVGFPIDLIRVAVPPLASASVTAELLLFAFRSLPNFISAVCAESHVVRVDFRSSGWFHRFAEVVPPAERLDRVDAETHQIGDFPVAVPH